MNYDEPHTRIQLSLMMLYLRHHPSGRLPTSRLVYKALALHQWLAAGPAHRAWQQSGNIAFQVVIGGNADGVFHTPLFQSLANLRLSEGRIRSKLNFLSHSLLSLDFR